MGVKYTENDRPISSLKPFNTTISLKNQWNSILLWYYEPLSPRYSGYPLITSLCCTEVNLHEDNQALFSGPQPDLNTVTYVTKTECHAHLSQWGHFPTESSLCFTAVWAACSSWSPVGQKHSLHYTSLLLLLLLHSCLHTANSNTLLFSWTLVLTFSPPCPVFL